MLAFLLQHGSEIAATAEGVAEAGAHEEAHFELWNIVEGIAKLTHNENLEHWLNPIYSLFIMFFIILPIFAIVARNLKKVPGRAQNFVEMIFSALEGFVVGMLGERGRTYIPLVGTIFIYILTMNLFGMVPIIGHSPSSNLNITLSLALIVFITVQVHGIRGLGIIGYLKHFCDLPLNRKATGLEIGMAPLMFLLHLTGELAKPLSLSLRLFGNITGEDVLIFIFVTLAMSILLPLHFFMYPIVLLGSLIQALVFTLLTTVYLLMMSPHTEEH